jgi:hypothetical protein
MKPRRFPLNAPGDFYVAKGMCMACSAPEHEAPDLMAHCTDIDGLYHCYFRRQPQTPEELDRAIQAVEVGCCGAVRYGGQNPEIVKRLQKWAAEACDHSPLQPPESRARDSVEPEQS